MTTKIGRTAAIILAGGSGQRFGSDKLMEPIAGVNVLVRSLRAFESCGAVDDIIVVGREDILSLIADLCREEHIEKLCCVVPGGTTRALSCMAGLNALADEITLVAVHDAARPMVTDDIITQALETAARFGAAVPAVSVKDTIKQAEDGVVLSTPDRSSLHAVQTPQCFQRDIICAAMRAAVENNLPVTDDCSAVEAAGGTVYLTPGSEQNIKITARFDIRIAECILKEREDT